MRVEHGGAEAHIGGAPTRCDPAALLAPALVPRLERALCCRAPLAPLDLPLDASIGPHDEMNETMDPADWGRRSWASPNRK